MSKEYENSCCEHIAGGVNIYLSGFVSLLTRMLCVFGNSSRVNSLPPSGGGIRSFTGGRGAFFTGCREPEEE